MGSKYEQLKKLTSEAVVYSPLEPLADEVFVHISGVHHLGGLVLWQVIWAVRDEDVCNRKKLIKGSKNGHIYPHSIFNILCYTYISAKLFGHWEIKGSVTTTSYSREKNKHTYPHVTANNVTMFSSFSYSFFHHILWYSYETQSVRKDDRSHTSLKVLPEVSEASDCSGQVEVIICVTVWWHHTCDRKYLTLQHSQNKNMSTCKHYILSVTVWWYHTCKIQHRPNMWLCKSQPVSSVTHINRLT